LEQGVPSGGRIQGESTLFSYKDGDTVKRTIAPASFAEPALAVEGGGVSHPTAQFFGSPILPQVLSPDRQATNAGKKIWGAI